MSALKQLLSAPAPDMASIAAHLDALAPDARLDEVTGLGLKAQSRLFAAAKGFRPIGLEAFVPPGTAPMTGVTHRGRNTLPAFTRFAKVFCRPDGDAAESGVLWGYNLNNAFISTVVGPGYFVAGPHGDGEVLIDYLRIPPRKPGPWPPILPNTARLSRFVYHKTQDVMRGVSEHVTIGRGTQGGKDLPAWFVLCRVD